jgi:hypothetical protein
MKDTKKFLRFVSTMSNICMVDGTMKNMWKINIIVDAVLCTINTFCNDHVLILYYRYLSKHRKTVDYVCEMLHISPTKFFTEQRIALEKFTACFSLNNTCFYGKSS